MSSSQSLPNLAFSSQLNDFLSGDPIAAGSGGGDATTTSNYSCSSKQQEESEPEESDKTTASEEQLHETRPNRWSGHPSTWRTLTKNERKIWQAIESARSKELSAHLYNVWSLRKGNIRPHHEKVDQIKEAMAGGWKKLGNKWTAWPMRAGEVPEDELLPIDLGNDGYDDDDKEFTFRREYGEKEDFVGRSLEEEIEAGILRVAGRRLRKGVLGDGGKKEVVGGVVQSVEGVMEAEVEATEEEGTHSDDGSGGAGGKKRKVRHVQPTFTPVLAADDESNYALLRPAARRIMGRLDGMLMVLHNARVAGVANESDEEEGDAEEDERFWGRVPPVQKEVKKEDEARSRGGRPKKERARLDGETEEEFQVRVARKLKRKLPDGDERSRPRSRFRGRRSRSISRASRASSRSKRSASQSSSASSTQSDRSRSDRWKPRDWRDILGAAVLAGFSPEVIARATQRCATLFREEITMNTLQEQPVSSDKPRIQTETYEPGVPLPLTSDEDEEEEEQQVINLRTVSRQSSAKLATPVAQEAEPATAASTPRRSRSATPGGMHLCTYPTCPRSVDGFTRKANLTRHIKLVHTKNNPEPEDDGDQDSPDEMDGAVHVDTFLKVIKVRKGWRGEDAGQRTRRYQKKASSTTRSGREETGDLTSDGDHI
ncbi:hypothetical protein QBC38DRAFT_467136 [Podospora fimiseda]|uniref:C2H2-type domain-containing protein n=1 Tax=Podospora fimiseda TaxID=252190 RepID=A0AAN7BX62_9PEZI|nr:hypothetical protein QBC38DRAFT_467136 [Podospora fimiseda]